MKRLILAIVISITAWAAPSLVMPSSPDIDYKLSGFMSKNWGLYNDSHPKHPSHIEAPRAWAIAKRKNRVVVAVIDTGIQLTNTELSVSRFGFNFVNNTESPLDDHGHGTHVAGIIEATSNHHVLLLPLKYFSDANPGTVNLRNGIKAINYAVDHGAKIINYSGGGPEFSEEEYLAIKHAEDQGVLVVAAAGNEHQDVDLIGNYYYPASYRTSNTITVTSTDINNELLPSSNWGQRKIDVAAPGENIFSTLPGGRHGYMSGTSQATAFVSGIAALMLSQNPKLKPQDIRRIIMDTVNQMPQLKDKVFSGGLVDEYKAVVKAKQFTPASE